MGVGHIVCKGKWNIFGGWPWLLTFNDREIKEKSLNVWMVKTSLLHEVSKCNSVQKENGT